MNFVAVVAVAVVVEYFLAFEAFIEFEVFVRSFEFLGFVVGHQKILPYNP